ncbi:MAG: DUF4410 domain-containing protein [Rickettsiales bacterium]|nr:DUF4410 domain-containing protein [Pseudomonadota bacterium]MDA0965629.1 DUF4410 domain-containing protein [Pseudomonadota bacterium]MDG4542953.1 DUF4410 domain-containing protein [Rickettsiales bacterium]MDG4544599.1 DUF4410 domain-containing protein [Rickettsiales bacterium]MDG4546721.1 DUF4410 domain-containing protein [Rickettsiales bacterium]
MKSASVEDTKKIDLSDYEVVFVQDFENKIPGSSSSALVDLAGKNYADKIAHKLDLAGVFEKVSREPVDGKALVVAGDITEYDDGNAALRMMIGFTAGNANFNADVYVIDNETKERLGHIAVDKNSWALGGAIAMSQNANVLMEDSVSKVVSQITGAKTTPVASNE